MPGETEESDVVNRQSCELSILILQPNESPLTLIRSTLRGSRNEIALGNSPDGRMLS